MRTEGKWKNKRSTDERRNRIQQNKGSQRKMKETEITDRKQSIETRGKAV